VVNYRTLMDEHVEKTIATYNAIAPYYKLTATPEVRAWEESSMRLFANYLNGSSVLVPGCGDGRDSRYLSSLGLDVFSFDLSDGMLSEARNLDPDGRYEKLDLRDIECLNRGWDGVYASGCLYHLTRSEFERCLAAIHTILAPTGIFYFNLKIGSGEEYRATPGARYPGGEVARQFLLGERYYAYYRRDEIANYLQPFERLYERDMEYAEEIVELWLRKGATPFHLQPRGL
jgi:SAM-dependent methyltransferase